MKEEEIRDEARKAANRSQFMSNHVYDHKSYEDGFYEGMSQALHQYAVMRSALAEQHKSTRYDAIDEVNNTSLYFQQRQDEGKLCFWEIMREMESLKRKIMNLRQR